MTWNRKLGRIVYAIYPFILVGALIFVGAFFLNFIAEHVESPVGYENAITINPNQTYIHNVTISYEVHGPSRGYGTRWENGSIVIEEPPFTNTLTSWQRAWLLFMVELNESRDVTAYINSSIVGPDGIIERWGTMSLAAGAGIGPGSPEVTQGGTYRLSLQNKGLEEIQLILSWHLDWYFYQKPYFYYGIAAIGIALVYPGIFLIKEFGPWKSKQQQTNIE